MPKKFNPLVDPSYAKQRTIDLIAMNVHAKYEYLSMERCRELARKINNQGSK